MARELVKKTIDDKGYEFSQYGSKQSVRMFLRVGKIVGAPLSMLGDLKIGDKGKISVTLASGMIAEAVDALMRRAETDEVLDILETLCSRDVLCEGKKIDFNLHYEGNLPHMLKVAAAALEVQYGNFLGAFSGSLVSQSGDTTQEPRT